MAVLRPWPCWMVTAVLLASSAILGSSGCKRSPGWDPLNSPNVTKLPAGAPPEGGPPAELQAGRWEDWATAELVLALYEPHTWGGEDTHHARVMVFADGRVLYRTREGGRWRWYLVDVGPQEAEALRRDVVADLRGSRSFSCSHATDQPSTVLMVRRRRGWLVREAYAFHMCLDDLEGPAIGASTGPANAPPPEQPPPEFVTAFRRLDWLPRRHVANAKRWASPRTYLMWSIDNGDYMDGPDGEPKGDPWPDDLPEGPAPAEGDFIMPIDGAYEDRLRDFMGSGALVRYRGERWSVQVMRKHPGDRVLRCVLYKECE